MVEKRAAALTNSPPLPQLCGAFPSSLADVKSKRLPSKQRVEGSNPSRDSTKVLLEACY